MQTRFDYYLALDLDEDGPTITGAESAKPARLVTGVPVGKTGFRRFSAVGSLLSINERQNKLARRNPPAGKPIVIATGVVAERFELDRADNLTHARILHTSRGPLTLGGRQDERHPRDGCNSYYYHPPELHRKKSGPVQASASLLISDPISRPVSGPTALGSDRSPYLDRTVRTVI